MDRAEAINYYAAQTKHLQEKLNEGVSTKRIKKGMLVLRYDDGFKNTNNKKFLTRWEGQF